jgi:hypothetical protein
MFETPNILYTWKGNTFYTGKLREFAKESVQVSLSNYDNVVLYCDNPELFQDFGFTKIFKVDYSQYDLDWRFYNLPKLITYKEQKDPFIHIDFDCIVYDKIVTDCELIIENRRNIPNKKYWRQIGHRIDQNYCTGIFGCNNVSYVSDMWNMAINYQHRHRTRFIKLYNIVTIDELLPVKLNEKHNLSIYNCTEKRIKIKHLAGKELKEKYMNQ